MTGSRGVGTVGTGANRDVLLATKLRPPPLRDGFVARPRLSASLADAVSRELVVVSAPAGFGKSSAIAEWAARCGTPVAWLSLDDADNDPVRFWRHVAAALDVARPGIAAAVGARSGGVSTPSYHAAVAALVNELAESAETVVLVLDDYHVVDSAAVHASLTDLLEHLPGALRLLVATRADPPLPLARMRARGRLAELRAEDLRFTVAESGALLGAATARSLSPEATATLAARTEGWAAGLQLAALSLARRTDVERFVTEFSGSNRFVLDYLTEEVLDGQSAAVRGFLLETSVLERLSGPLCDAVRGRDDSQELLEQIEQANLFLHPLDDVRRWWRYHHLFADLLRARLAREQPGRVADLHRAAGDWFARHGLADQAVHHLLAIGDHERAADIVGEQVPAQLRRREAATLYRWLAALPRERLRLRPHLCATKALAALVSGHVEEVEPLLAEAEGGLDAGAESGPGLGPVPAVVALVRAELALRTGGGGAAVRHARDGLTLVDRADGYLEYFLRYDLAAGFLLEGAAEAAEPLLDELAVHPWAARADPFFAARTLSLIGWMRVVQGRLDEALRIYRNALDTWARPTDRTHLPDAGVAHARLAQISYLRGELDAAAEQAEAAVEQCRRLGRPRWQVTALVTAARIRHARGEDDRATEALDEAGGLAAGSGVAGPIAASVGVQAARIALARGRVDDVADWVRGRGFAPGDEPHYPREPEYLLLARFLLRRQPRQAVQLLAGWHDLAESQHRTGSVVEIRVLAALAHAELGDPAGAATILVDALALAAPHRQLQVFVDEGAAAAALLRELLVGRRLERLDGGRAVPHAFLSALSAAFHRSGHPLLPAARPGAVAAPGLVEPLTAREQEILSLLADGRPNRAIAEELVISVDTVKRHVTHLLDKLAAGNRTEAVARARVLGLLS
ncbi:LuxR C-terminal-related transcriptional regulator [Pseudonocardia sp. RS11V-5]|uniref:LuxR C-terminal-related transcriptional regulator n=1 Tax=Pseudonocardia terrae TaxID=2905831 RepID=UPI001E437C91|nr:LuxR C-terminal-related transcriptional regulator [Pseudonocardia terrae]MCE3550702.1 LuxR C-terminal-related transcriptional regulator [Pseudonocardia terrae]